MFQAALLYAMQFVGIVVALVVTTIIITANIYDVRLAAAKRRLAVKTKRRSKPMLSIIVCVDSAGQKLDLTLDSIRRSGYRKLECIVADNVSGSGSRSVVKAYAKRYESLAIFCLRKQKRVSRQRLLTEALERYGSGDIALWLQAGDIIERGGIDRLVTMFEQSDADIVRPRITLTPQQLLGSTLKTYQLILDNTINKSLSIMRAMPPSLSRGIATAQSITDEARPLKTAFAYDIAVTDTSDWTLSRFYADSFRTMSAYYTRLAKRLAAVVSRGQNTRHVSWLFVAILQSAAGFLLPFILCYFVYMALFLLQPIFLAVSLGTASTILLYCIWGEFSMPLLSRLRLSFGIPITFFAYFVLSFMPIVALFSVQADN